MVEINRTKYVPDGVDTDTQAKLEKLAETVIETITEHQDDNEPLDEWMVKYHDITIKQFIEHVQILMDNGMTFSAARAYAIEQHTSTSKIGTRRDGDHQAEMTGVSTASHKQLLLDAEQQIDESRGLQYCETSQRPLKILGEGEFEGYSDFAEGDYMNEMNPMHHGIRVIVGEYAFNPVTDTPDSDVEVTDEGVGEGEGVSPPVVPQYAVFFEIYTGNGIIDASETFPIQGQRLHSVETGYYEEPGVVLTAIGEKLKYIGDDEKYRVESFIEELSGELEYGGDIEELMRVLQIY